MDQSYSESDVSLSPSQILDRLQVLRQLQLLQRGKLQKQRLQYQDTAEASLSIKEIVSQLSSSTSYNTFRSLLQSPHDTSNEASPREDNSKRSDKLQERDLIEGVSVLNLSQESEFIVNSPLSTKSRLSVPSRPGTANEVYSNEKTEAKSAMKKHIALDEMPILSPKQDFEELILEKLKNEQPPNHISVKKDNEVSGQGKKPFLRRGEGMNRFGVRKNDLVIQNTKALPWRQKKLKSKTILSPMAKNPVQQSTNKKRLEVQIIVNDSERPLNVTHKNVPTIKLSNAKEKPKPSEEPHKRNSSEQVSVDSSHCELHSNSTTPGTTLQLPKGKHPLVSNRGKTWAAVLTKEQDDFLRKLKQSDYYKNFVSPAKISHSDMSCDENLSNLKQARELAEQNMFELLENKVTHESFSLENSFFNKFLKRNNLECSGESTPLIMQKCLEKNPGLMHIFPELNHRRRNDTVHSEAETCNSDYTDCCSDTCSSVSSCCSCKTVEEANQSPQKKTNKVSMTKDTGEKQAKKPNRKEAENKQNVECQNDTVTENDTLKANMDMAEMNAKLVATSELLKDRLRELEDEIETFRKENANLAKLREEVDMERHKFYEEKNAYEQKFNEEKILSEYYLAEEKEKLTKQKQIYERQVREMRGRLSKKDKDDVINLKKEINDLKEEIRMKDAKSTSHIARLRNQIKIMEKEKKGLEDDVENLKKENRRIQHSNDITRRLTNMKYLEQINKKLTHMATKDTQSEVHLDNDMKYKAHEIERQSRSRKKQPVEKNSVRPRAKSVPNLKVTSRYAKYFSQRDAISQMDQDQFDNEGLHMYNCHSYDDIDPIIPQDMESIQDNNETSDIEDNLEKLYTDRFQSNSPTSNRFSLSNASSEKGSFRQKPDNFFIRKSNTNSRDSKSPNHNSTSPYLQNSSSSNRSKSPISIISHRLSGRNSPQSYTILQNNSSESNRMKSPISILTNRSFNSQRSATVINKEQVKDKLAVSPEPSTSKTSLGKTNLQPTEIQKSDGSRELRFPNGNVKFIAADGNYTKFVYYNGDVKENFLSEGRIKYYYAEAKTYHTTHADGLEVLEFPDGQVEKRYKDGSSEIRLPNGSIRYFDPKNEHVREEWRFPDGAALTVAADGEQRIVFSNGQVEVHAKDHKRREFPDGTVKLVYTDGTSETRYASGRVRVKDRHGNLVMDSAPG